MSACSAEGFGQLGLAQQGETEGYRQGGTDRELKTEYINLCSVYGHLRTREKAAENHGESSPCALPLAINLELL